jgi:hypothetical protein
MFTVESPGLRVVVQAAPAAGREVAASRLKVSNVATQPESSFALRTELWEVIRFLHGYRFF